MAEEFTGYDIEQNGEQDRANLEASSISFAYAAGAERHHLKVDPRGKLKVEMQFALSSCTGNGMTTASECVAGFQAGSFDSVKQLSRWYAYKMGQKCWGHEGRDVGCSIQGVVDAAKKYGMPLESVVPYPAEYNNKPFSQVAHDNAAMFRIKSHIRLTSFDDWINFIDGGFGAICFGVVWTKRMRSCTGVLKLADVKEDGSRGGHCMAGTGFVPVSETGGLSGDVRAIWANSHSAKWANGGYAEVEPEAIEYLLQRPNTVAIGVTDLTGFDTTRVLTQSKGMG